MVVVVVLPLSSVLLVVVTVVLPSVVVVVTVPLESPVKVDVVVECVESTRVDASKNGSGENNAATDSQGGAARELRARHAGLKDMVRSEDSNLIAAQLRIALLLLSHGSADLTLKSLRLIRAHQTESDDRLSEAFALSGRAAVSDRRAIAIDHGDCLSVKLTVRKALTFQSNERSQKAGFLRITLHGSRIGESDSTKLQADQTCAENFGRLGFHNYPVKNYWLIPFGAEIIIKYNAVQDIYRAPRYIL